MVKGKKRETRQSKTSRQSVKPQLPANLIIANNPAIDPVDPIVETFAYNGTNKPPNLILEPKQHNTSNKHVSFNRNAESQYGLHPMDDKYDKDVNNNTIPRYRLLEKVGPDPIAIHPDEGFWYDSEHKKEQQNEISDDPTNPNNRSFRGRHYLSRRLSTRQANTLFKTNNPEKNKRWWWWFGRGITKKRGKSKSKRRLLKVPK